MTKREIAFFACRLMAIYLFMSSFFQLSHSLSNPLFNSLSLSYTSTPTQTLVVNINNRPPTPFEWVMVFLNVVAPTLCLWFAAIGLWFLAREFAVRLFENVPEDVSCGPAFSIGAEARSLVGMLVGLWFLMQDLTYLGLWAVSHLWEALRWTLPLYVASYSYSFFTWEWLVRIPISLWLIFGLRGLGGLWRQAQEKAKEANRPRRGAPKGNS